MIGCGYRAILELKIHRSRNDTDSIYLLVYFEIVKGPFDEFLLWPVCDTFTVELKGKDDSIIRSFISPKNDMVSGKKPTPTEVIHCGFNQFLNLDQIQEFIVDDDSLEFFVSEFQEHELSTQC